MYKIVAQTVELHANVVLGLLYTRHTGFEPVISSVTGTRGRPLP